MSETVQVNIRVPAEARDVLTRIGARLRADPSFADQLEALLAEDAPATGLSLAERMARIEEHLGIAEKTDTPQRVAPDTPALTTGEGRGRRLTPAGEKDLELRLGAGQPETDIAEAMGISINTVRARRKAMDERLL